MRKMILKREVFLSRGKAAKWDGSPMIDNPRFGFNWFYFRPHFHWNKGIPFKHAVTDMGFSWLCYFWNITIYWRRYKHDGSNQVGLSAKQ